MSDKVVICYVQFVKDGKGYEGASGDIRYYTIPGEGYDTTLKALTDAGFKPFDMMHECEEAHLKALEEQQGPGGG